MPESAALLPQDLTPRRLQGEDAPAYRALMQDACGGHPLLLSGAAASPPWPFGDGSLWRPPEVSGLSVWGFMHEGRCVGAAALHRLAAPHADHRAEIRGLAVSPGWRRRGLGQRLLACLREEALSWPGLRRLELTVDSADAAALACAQAAGFRVEALQPMAIRLGGTFHDACWLSAPLPEQAHELHLADAEVAACWIESLDGPAGPLQLRVRFSAAPVRRMRAGDAPQWGHVSGVVLTVGDLLAAPRDLGLIGRVRSGWVHPGPGMPARRWLAMPLASVPPHAPDGEDTPAVMLHLDGAQGDVLQVQGRTLELAWPAGACWTESLAC